MVSWLFSNGHDKSHDDFLGGRGGVDEAKRDREERTLDIVTLFGMMVSDKGKKRRRRRRRRREINWGNERGGKEKGQLIIKAVMVTPLFLHIV